jgi:BASS family bile acid:Na+ symporter
MDRPIIDIRQWLYRLAAAVTFVLFIQTVYLIASGRIAAAGLPFVGTLFAAAYAVRGSQILRGSSFSFLVFAFLAAGIYYPGLFTEWFGFSTMPLVVPLIQTMMF